MVLLKRFAVLVLGVVVAVSAAPGSRVVGNGMQQTLTTEMDGTKCEKVEKYTTEVSALSSCCNIASTLDMEC